MDNIDDYKTKRSELFVKLKEYNAIYGFNDTIEQFEDDILKLNDPYLSYHFADSIGGNIIKHGKVVLESKIPEYNYYFARVVSGANMKAHEKVVLESKNPEYNYYFAVNVSGADMKAHEQVVIESKDPKFNYEFAKYVWSDNKNNIKAHEQAILESKDPEYNYKFAYTFAGSGADVRAHGQVVLESKNLKYNYEFATIPGADYDAHAQLIIDSGDPEYNYMFCEYVKSCNFMDHARVVMQSDRGDYKSELREKYEYELKRSKSKAEIKQLLKSLSNE